MNKQVYGAKEIKEILGIGINQTYALLKSDELPVITLGRKYCVAQESFNEWLIKGNRNKLCRQPS